MLGTLVLAMGGSGVPPAPHSPSPVTPRNPGPQMPSPHDPPRPTPTWKGPPGALRGRHLVLVRLCKHYGAPTVRRACRTVTCPPGACGRGLAETQASGLSGRRGDGPGGPLGQGGRVQEVQCEQRLAHGGGVRCPLAAARGGLISPRPRDTCYYLTFSILAILVGGTWRLL